MKNCPEPPLGLFNILNKSAELIAPDTHYEWPHITKQTLNTWLFWCHTGIHSIYSGDPVCRRCLWLLWLLAHSPPVFPVSVIRPRPGPGSLASGQWTLTLPHNQGPSGVTRGGHTITSHTEGGLSSCWLRGQRRIAGWRSEGRPALVTGDNGQSWAQPVRSRSQSRRYRVSRRYGAAVPGGPAHWWTMSGQ